MKSALSYLECRIDGNRYDPDVPQHLCSCGKPLLARYDFEAAAKTFTRESLRQREASVWRYTELLPLRDPESRISLGETFTPIIPMHELGAELGLQHLSIKDEGLLPTGSFKARGAAVGVSRARELGVKAFGMPTNGNAGGAWSAYGARAGIESYIVMPRDAPVVNRLECVMAGAHVWLVNGVITDAGKIIAGAVSEYGLYDASTLKEPYRIEGKKTLGYEIVEQFDWQVPDVILYPTGGGVGLIGIYKAIRDLQHMKLLGDKMPRFVVVQAEGCAPIVRAWQEHKSESEFWKDSRTIAFGINVPKALGDFLILEALALTNGYAVAVSDETILEMEQRVGRREGLFLCPEGAATIAAAAKLRADGWIAPDETVLAINTGAGIKYPSLPIPELPLLEPGARIVIETGR